MEIYLKKSEKENIKKIKSGWSWTCFFFCFYGVPLFNRGLIGHGILMVFLCLLMIVTYSIDVGEFCINYCQTIYFSDLLSLIMLPFGFFYSIRGNRLGIKQLQKEGWVVCEPTSEEAKLWAESLIKAS